MSTSPDTDAQHEQSTPARPTLDELQAYVDTNQQLRDAVGADADEPLTLSVYAQGEYNANYLFSVAQANGATPKQLLLRVNMGSQMHLVDQIGYEMGALRLLESSGRTPRALYVDGSGSKIPWGVGVEEWLPGGTLDYRRDLACAAQILADVHAVPVTDQAKALLVTPAHPLGAIVDECRQMFGVYRMWAHADEEVVRTVERMFARSQRIADSEHEQDSAGADGTDGAGGSRAGGLARHIVNTEVNSGNFLINRSDDADQPGAGCAGRTTGSALDTGSTANTGYLIDWEKPVLGQVEQDIGHFLAPTTTFWKTDVILTPQERAAFIEHYVAAVAGRFDVAGIEERLGDYLVVTCLRGVTWCAMAYTEYEGGGRALANPDTYEKIKAYLSDGFLARVIQEYY